ncbi:MAG: hypothetical protein NVS2B15_20570 [Pseudarthrobacter sp.]
MFSSWFVVSALGVLFGAAAILGLGEAVLATGPAARADAAAAAALAAVMAAVGLGWAPLGAVLLLVVLGVVFLWFAGRLAIYSAAQALVAGLVTILAGRGGGSVTEHPSHELSAILVLVMGAILMVFAAAGWLLGTFAMPKEGSAKPVPRLRGIRQALLAAGLAVALYAIS